jgi:glycosyltransferase involved in cell wall biosynthesis
MMVSRAPAGQYEILVVCNGCTDNTAEVARLAHGQVRVIETAKASKAAAINLGLDHAIGHVVIVADADVQMTWEDLRILSEALHVPGILAAAPSVETEFLLGTNWSVLAYYRLWMALPYVRDGMMAAGVYALNAHGLSRLGRLPEVLADDGYVRAIFNSSERVEVPESTSRVRAPADMRSLIKIKTRSRLGTYELKRRFPDLSARDRADRNYLRAFAMLIRSIRLWPCILPYLYVNIVSRLRAARQLRLLDNYVWERDESSRSPTAQTPGTTDPTNRVPGGDNCAG